MILMYVNYKTDKTVNYRKEAILSFSNIFTNSSFYIPVYRLLYSLHNFNIIKYVVYLRLWRYFRLFNRKQVEIISSLVNTYIRLKLGKYLVKILIYIFLVYKKIRINFENLSVYLIFFKSINLSIY